MSGRKGAKQPQPKQKPVPAPRVAVQPKPKPAPRVQPAPAARQPQNKPSGGVHGVIHHHHVVHEFQPSVGQPVHPKGDRRNDEADECWGHCCDGCCDCNGCDGCCGSGCFGSGCCDDDDKNNHGHDDDNGGNLLEGQEPIVWHFRLNPERIYRSYRYFGWLLLLLFLPLVPFPPPKYDRATMNDRLAGDLDDTWVKDLQNTNNLFEPR
ncbi:hypothetical protein M408DRAFT_13040 [Serendipita vermifera MAFF 305830]|uniref:Uncharacterized protein n=1 Tax=Serendipita vermifera MAFF 305830 TaxID=933852 RepID=A0A0C3AM58_SERVB|nr:hypothetical protein M408DRAFT_13040 [Serendipita vermifera MAFF 305830]